MALGGCRPQVLPGPSAAGGLTTQAATSQRENRSMLSSHAAQEQKKKNRTPPKKKLTHIGLGLPTTQLAKMSIDPKFVELTADVLEIVF